MNISNALIPTTEICSQHKIKKVRTQHSEPFCEECQKMLLGGFEQFYALENQGKFRSPLEIKELLNYRKKSIISDLTLNGATFENFRINNDKEQEVFDLMIDRTSRMVKGETFNLLLTGTAGLGKSHLAMSILKEVNNHTYPVLYKKTLFAGVSEVLSEIRNSFDDKYAKFNEYKMTKLLVEPDILVLDDLGSESGSMNTTKQASDFTQRVLYNVFNGRQGKCTIVTTNYSGEQLQRVYDQKLLSRILYNAKGNIISFDGIKDKRIQLI